MPAYAIQERAVSENPNAGPQGAGWKEEEAYTLEARHHVQMVAAPVYQESEYGIQGYDTAGTLREGRIPEHQMIVAAPLTKGSATGEGVNAPGHRQEDDVNIVAYALRKDPGGTGQGHNTNYVAGTVRSHTRPGSNTSTEIVESSGVRRLTPTECERLQGLPDGWTQLGGTPDSRRYSALGDAVTANVAEWLGQRLEAA